jgi:hypothetical protein
MEIPFQLHHCFKLFCRAVIAGSSNLALWIASAGLFCFGPFTVCCNGIEFSTVALEGRAAPDTLTGVTFTSLQSPSLNNSGKVSFSAFVTGIGVNTTNSQGIWSDRFGNLSIVVRNGDQVPSEPADTKFDRFRLGTSTLLDDRGHITFLAALTGMQANMFHGIWTATDNGITKIAKVGESVPGAPSGTVFESFRDSLLLNNVGTVGFTSTLYRPGDVPPNFLADNYDAAFSATPGNISLLAGLTTNYPTMPPGTTVYLASSLALNDIGQSLVYVSFERNGVPDSNYNGLFLSDAGSVRLLARSEVPAPGFTGGVTFASLNNPSALNNAGRVAFKATLSAGTQGIWSDRGAGLSLVAHPSTPLQGELASFRLNGFGNLAINDSGLIAFEGSLSGPGVGTGNSGGIFKDNGIDGTLLIARQGAKVPGMPSNIVFKAVQIPAVNELGQVLFSASIGDINIKSDFHPSLWLAQPDGAIQKVISDGDQFTVAPGDVRTVRTFSLDSNHGFNDAGQIALHIDFTNGTEGVFVTNALAVPETSIFGLTPFALLAVAMTRRRALE